jgi:hypothetical protein
MSARDRHSWYCCITEKTVASRNVTSCRLVGSDRCFSVKRRGDPVKNGTCCHPDLLDLISKFTGKGLSSSLQNIVACRPVAGQRPRGRQIYNGHYRVTASQTNNSTATVGYNNNGLRQQTRTQQLEIATEERCILRGPRRDVKTQVIGVESVSYWSELIGELVS